MLYELRHSLVNLLKFITKINLKCLKTPRHVITIKYQLHLKDL